MKKETEKHHAMKAKKRLLEDEEMKAEFRETVRRMFELGLAHEPEPYVGPQRIERKKQNGIGYGN